ncbi:MAG: hypothetical protein A2176_08825 [Spirochaetes bacterium RBG_13_51_14]|nr:MAG: hypothetical protein A2176_08825 [Spirochaetes bacterium RBG_13_51_14]
MATYYVKIKGKNYDKKLIARAKSSVRKKGDGRISLKDAKIILGTVKDSADYTDIEKNTIRYIRDNYSFTPEADRWFRKEIRTWAATRISIKKKAPRASKRPEKKKPPAIEISDEHSPREQAVQIHRTPVKDSSAPGRRSFLKIAAIILVILALIIIGLFLSSRGKEYIAKYCSACDALDKKLADWGMEPKKPTVEAKKDISTAEQKPVEKQEDNAQYYIVQTKDDLVSISEKILGHYSRWTELYKANRDIIKNPTVIFPGQKLKIPAIKEGAQ